MATKEICDSCLRSDQEILAITWCSDCEEKLCENCDKAHRVGKLTLSHRLNEFKELPSISKKSALEYDLCERHQKPLDFFCSFHDAVCCRVCIPASHKTCEKIEPIEDVCENIKSSALVENLPDDVCALLQMTNRITLNREKNISVVKEQKDKIKEQITSLKTNATALLDTLEQTLLGQLEELDVQTCSDLDNETKKFQQLSEKLEDMKQELDFCIKFGSNRKLFLLAQMLRNQLIVIDESIQDFVMLHKNINFHYSEDSTLSTVISNLANVSVVNTDIDMQHTSVVRKGVQSTQSLVSFTSRESIDLSGHGITSITAIEITEDDSLLLCSCDDQIVLLYKPDGTFLLKKRLRGKPYQIAGSKEKFEAAITFLVGNKIVIIDTKSLKVIRHIDTNSCYHGIIELSEMAGLIVGGTRELNMITLDGIVKHSTVLSSGDMVRSIKKHKGGTFLCTDSSDLVCVNLLDGSEVFRYTGLKAGRGIEQDKNGYIYIADMRKNEIHRINTDGTFVDIALAEADGIVKPFALKFSRDKSLLYVGFVENNHIAVFTCK